MQRPYAIVDKGIPVLAAASPVMLIASPPCSEKKRLASECADLLVKSEQVCTASCKTAPQGPSWFSAKPLKRSRASGHRRTGTTAGKLRRCGRSAPSTRCATGVWAEWAESARASVARQSPPGVMRPSGPSYWPSHVAHNWRRPTPVRQGASTGLIRSKSLHLFFWASEKVKVKYSLLRSVRRNWCRHHHKVQRGEYGDECGRHSSLFP